MTSIITEGVESMVRRLDGFPATVALHSVPGGGGRKTHRFCIAPTLTPNQNSSCFCGVFDGSFGDFASNTVKDLVVPMLKRSTAFKNLKTNNETMNASEKMELLHDAMVAMFEESEELLLRATTRDTTTRDAMPLLPTTEAELLLRKCAASTAATLVLWENFVCVGHLGDTRICLIWITNKNIEKLCLLQDASSPNSEKHSSKFEECFSELGDENREKKKHSSKNIPYKNKVDDFVEGHAAWDASMGGTLQTNSIPYEKVEDFVEGHFVTHDHKPDQSQERERIESRGGSVKYDLYQGSNRPFLFRTNKGSTDKFHCSRALGGQHLKPFGLTATPTVAVHKRKRQFLGYILASAGLWNTLSANMAARSVIKAYLKGQNMGRAVVNEATPRSTYGGKENRGTTSPRCVASMTVSGVTTTSTGWMRGRIKR